MPNANLMPFMGIVEKHPLIVYHVSSLDYVSLQLSTPLDDDDDAILLYLIDEGDGTFTLSDSAWMASLLPYGNDRLTDEAIAEKALELGFSLNGLSVYLLVTPETLFSAIERFDKLVRTLQAY